MASNTVLIIYTIGITIGLIAFVATIAYSNYEMQIQTEQIRNSALTNYQNNVNGFKEVLDLNGFTVQQAQFNSPDITVICPTQASFYEYARQLNTTTVYQVSKDMQLITIQEIQVPYHQQVFYVVDATVTYAYSYSPPFNGSK